MHRRIGHDLDGHSQSIDEMLAAAQLDWTVEKYPLFAKVNGKRVQAVHELLVRSSDGKVLDEVPENWIPVQNRDALAMVQSYATSKKMQIVSGGSLKGGRLVWFLVKTGHSVEVVPGDWIDNHLLFTNPHHFGKSVGVRFAPIRRVSRTMMTLPVHSRAVGLIRASHRVAFDPVAIESEISASERQMSTYLELGRHLSSRKSDDEAIDDYMRSVFPVITGKDVARKARSFRCRKVLELLHNHPGSDFAPGTWWQALNAVIYYIDHEAAGDEETRALSAWFTDGRKFKDKALKAAVAFCDNSEEPADPLWKTEVSITDEENLS